jgi:hypothetical protein
MGGQMQQSNAAAATALYDHTGGGSLHNAGPASDAGDAVMARWLQSAGLQHLASPLASTGIDHRLLPNLLMQVIISSLLKPIRRVVYVICLLITDWLMNMKSWILLKFLNAFLWMAFFLHKVCAILFCKSTWLFRSPFSSIPLGLYYPVERQLEKHVVVCVLITHSGCLLLLK